MKNGDKVLYFESVNGTYVMPVTSFNLYDNQGKSLTVVNQHFFISQLVNRINIDYQKGNFLNDDDIVKFLNDVKSTVESDDYLIKLFKGSLMREIDEDNFESNKRELIKYLDKFKINNFVDYNNFSIFNGSLEKVSSDNNQTGAEEVEVEEVFDSENIDVEEVNENVVEGVNDSLKDVEVREIIDDSSVEEVNTNSLDVSVPTFSLNINFEGVKSNNVDVIDESISQNDIIVSDDVDDLFDTMLSDINNGAGSSNLSNIDYNDIIDNAHDAINDDDFNQQPIINDSVQSVFSSNEGPGVMPSSDFNAGLNNTEQQVSNVEQPVLNESVQPVVEQFGVFEPNVNVDLNKNVISDKNDLPELDSIPDNVDNKTSKGGKKIGVVIFMIFLIVLLMVGAYFIYFKVLS